MSYSRAFLVRVGLLLTFLFALAAILSTLPGPEFSAEEDEIVVEVTSKVSSTMASRFEAIAEVGAEDSARELERAMAEVLTEVDLPANALTVSLGTPVIVSYQLDVAAVTAGVYVVPAQAEPFCFRLSLSSAGRSISTPTDRNRESDESACSDNGLYQASFEIFK